MIEVQSAINNAVASSAGLAAPRTTELQKPPDMQAALTQYYAAQEKHQEPLRRQTRIAKGIHRKQESLARLQQDH